MNFPSKLALAVSCALLTGQAFCGDTKEKAGVGLAIETAADQFPLGTAYRSAGGDYLGLQTVKGTQVDYLGNSSLEYAAKPELIASGYCTVCDRRRKKSHKLATPLLCHGGWALLLRLNPG